MLAHHKVMPTSQRPTGRKQGVKKAVLALQILAQVLLHMLPVGAGMAHAYGRADTKFLAGDGAEKNCPPTSRSMRAGRLSQALGSGFGVQYWGESYSAETLSDQPHGLLVIEAAKVGALFSETGGEDLFTTDEIAQINRAGTRPVLAYLNASKIEDYRDYWVDLTGEHDASVPLDLPEWIGPREGHGQILAAYWTKGWESILLERVDMLMARGFDGLFLDDVLLYYTHAFDRSLVWTGATGPKGPDTAADFAIKMMRLIEKIAARARHWNCEAIIIVNNGAFIGRDALDVHPAQGPFSMFSRYVTSIDGILVENVLSEAVHPHTLEALSEDFLANEIPVLSVEFTPEFPASATENIREYIRERAMSLGFSPYVAEDYLFDRLYPAIITHQKGPHFP